MQESLSPQHAMFLSTIISDLRSCCPDIFRVGHTPLLSPQFCIPLLDHDLRDLRRFGFNRKAEFEVIVPSRTVLERSIAIVVANIGSKSYFGEEQEER